jgi:hypothetical protein
MNKRKSQSGQAPNVGEGDDTPRSPEEAARMAEYIGRELRSMFDGVVAENVPERFRQLLAELEAKKPKD